MHKHTRAHGMCCSKRTIQRECVTYKVLYSPDGRPNRDISHGTASSTDSHIFFLRRRDALSEALDSEPLDSEPLDLEPLDSEPLESEPLDLEPLDSEPDPPSKANH